MCQAIGTVIWAVLAACCIAIAAYELMRSVRPEITIDKLIAAGICALWYIGACIALGGPECSLASVL